jgi:ADP-heptose:LPS heptosyltransferase
MSSRTADGRILGIVYGHLADTMAAIPALRSLRQALPAARLEVLALRAVEPVLRPCPYIDDLVVWDDFRHKGSRAARAEKAAVVGSLALRLRRRQYDTVLVLHRSAPAMAVLASGVGAALSVGVAGRGGPSRYSHPLPPPEGVESSREENARVLAAIGVEDDGGPVELWTGAGDHRRAAEILNGHRRPMVGLHAGSDWSCQQWLPERFAEVGAVLQRSLGATIVLTGSAGEVALQEEIATRLPQHPLRAAGRTSFGELVEVIRRLDLLVCVNSAAAAIAQAVGTRCLVVLGPEDARLTGLVSAGRCRILQPGGAADPGSWCQLGRWGVLSGCESPTCRGLGGLDQLSAAEVTRAAIEMLPAGGRWSAPPASLAMRAAPL